MGWPPPRCAHWVWPGHRLLRAQTEFVVGTLEYGDVVLKLPFLNRKVQLKPMAIFSSLTMSSLLPYFVGKFALAEFRLVRTPHTEGHGGSRWQTVVLFF